MESKRTLVLQWVAQGALNKSQTKDVLSAVGILPNGLSWRTSLGNLFYG